jgi:hypothetical protein
MSSDISMVIDDYCSKKYSHTNWAWVSTLNDEQKSWSGNIEGDVKFFDERLCEGCDKIISECEYDIYCAKY